MLNFDTPQVTRMAPSPTGPAHIGSARTALLNYLAAKSSGGKFIVRIDDTDKERSKKEFEENILKTFEWLGLEHDEIHWQSERFDRYAEVAKGLLETGYAREQDGALFFNPITWVDEWEDIITGKMPVTAKDKESISNLVLLRADGSPTYHFASCVDDADMGITLIIRGTDHITNTAKHVQLFKLLTENAPKFAHVGLIFHNGKKISKRDGVSNMDEYRDRYLAESVNNALLKLGWGHPDANLDKTHPLIDSASALKLFPEGRLKAAKSTLDLDKLAWLDKRYRSQAHVVDTPNLHQTTAAGTL